MRGQDQRYAAGRQQLRSPSADREGVGVQNQGAFCILQDEPNHTGSSFTETEPGSDNAGVRFSEKRENTPKRFTGKAAVFRRLHRRDHSAVTAGCGDRIDGFGDDKLCKPRTAALTGVCRQYRRTGKACGTCDNQDAAVRILMAALFAPRERKVVFLRD